MYFRQILHPRRGIHLSFHDHFRRQGPPHSIYVGKSNVDSFIFRKIDA